MCFSNYTDINEFDNPNYSRFTLWECEGGNRWSTKYDAFLKDGQTCTIAGHGHNHKIRLVRYQDEYPRDWYRDK